MVDWEHQMLIYVNNYVPPWNIYAKPNLGSTKRYARTGNLIPISEEICTTDADNVACIKSNPLMCLIARLPINFYSIIHASFWLIFYEQTIR